MEQRTWLHVLFILHDTPTARTRCLEHQCIFFDIVLMMNRVTIQWIPSKCYVCLASISLDPGKKWRRVNRATKRCHILSSSQAPKPSKKNSTGSSLWLFVYKKEKSTKEEKQKSKHWTLKAWLTAMMMLNGVWLQYWNIKQQQVCRYKNKTWLNALVIKINK